jgi:hypothetical protein
MPFYQHAANRSGVIRAISAPSQCMAGVSSSGARRVVHRAYSFQLLQLGAVAGQQLKAQAIVDAGRGDVPFSLLELRQSADRLRGDLAGQSSAVGGAAVSNLPP